MNKEDKEQLLRDLASRLPYGVKVYGLYSPEGSFYSGWHNGELIAIDRTNTKNPSFAVQFEKPASYKDWCRINEIKPYLRPMSSMTKEEEKEYSNFIDGKDSNPNDLNWLATHISDWLDRKMFDHRGLIPKSLALEALEDMYKIE